MRKDVASIMVFALVVALCMAESTKLEVTEESTVPAYLGNVYSYTYRTYKFCVPFNVRADKSPNLDMLVEVDTAGMDLSKGYPVIVAINWASTPGVGLDTQASRVLMEGESFVSVPLSRFGQDPLDLSASFLLENTVDSAQTVGPTLGGLLYSNAPISRVVFTVTGSLNLVQYGECATCPYNWDLCGRCGAAQDICMVPSGPCRLGDADICDESLPFQSDNEEKSEETGVIDLLLNSDKVSTVLAWISLIPVALIAIAFACVLNKYSRRNHPEQIENAENSANDSDVLDAQLDDALLAPRDPEDGTWGIYPKLSDADSVSQDVLDAALVPVQALDENGVPQIFYVSASYFSQPQTN